MRRVLVALLVLLLSAPVQAAVTLIDSDYINEAQGVGGNTLALTVTAAAGDAICACGILDSDDLAIGISDDDGSTYNHLARSAGPPYARMACALNVTASGGSVVVTGQFNAPAYRGLFVQVFRGVATSAAVEDSDTATGSSAAPATPAVTLSGTGMVTACTVYRSGVTVTATAPLTNNLEDESWTNVAGAMSYGAYSGAGFTPAWTLGSSADWSAQAIALLELAAVSSSSCTRLLLGVGRC